MWIKWNDHLPVAVEHLRGDDAVELLFVEQFFTTGVTPCHAILAGDSFPQLGTQLGDGNDLAVGDGNVILKMSTLPHAADAHESNANALIHFPPPRCASNGGNPAVM